MMIKVLPSILLLTVLHYLMTEGKVVSQMPKDKVGNCFHGSVTSNENRSKYLREEDDYEKRFIKNCYHGCRKDERGWCVPVRRDERKDVVL
ncbi:UNVERIFIED_CONTAM: hypothetical protein PYX00_003942 [Menopon gallinae]|uniref:Uncharacterized protein n=1 Tax=Menopon gallinae TaxID=328185 RepID=A0AAW2I4F9_9NEOP